MNYFLPNIKRTVRLTFYTLVLLALLFPAVSLAAENTAVDMRLTKVEGDVTITNLSGKSVPARKDIRLYDGYNADTAKKSYAWINLDNEKLIKLDASSGVGIQKTGSKLEVFLKKGKLFFNVSKPLEDTESLDIRTSTMALAIRGTCGWVEVTDKNETKVAILEGTVEVTVIDQVSGQVKTDTVKAGETVICRVYEPNKQGDKCDILRDKFTKEDIWGFVLVELEGNPNLIETIYKDTQEEIDLRPVTAPDAEFRLYRDEMAAVASAGDKSHNGTDSTSTGKTAGITAKVSQDVPVGDTYLQSSASKKSTSAYYAPWSNSGLTERPDINPLPSFGIGMVEVAPKGAGSAVWPWSPGTAAPPSQGTSTPGTGMVTTPADDIVRIDASTATAEQIQAYLDDGKKVTVTGAYKLDGNLTVPAGASLTFSDQVVVAPTGVFTINGELNALAGIQNAGTIEVGAPTRARAASSASRALNVSGTLGGDGLITVAKDAVVKAGTFEGKSAIDPGAKLYSKAGAPQVGFAGGFKPLNQSWEADEDGYRCFNHTAWTLDEGTGTLTISGVGEMRDFEDVRDTPLPWNKEEVKKAVITEGVTSVGDWAFGFCEKLTEVSLPQSVTKIGGAFVYCTALTEIELPKDVTSIGDGAFSCCFALSSIEIPNGVTSIGEGTFSSCRELKSITMPDGVTQFGEFAFAYCDKLKDFTFPTNLTQIGGSAFSDCVALTEIIIPKGVTQIGNYAFGGCNGVEKIIIQEGVTKIEIGAFFNCAGVKSVTLPEGLVQIDRNAFFNCPELTDINIPNSVEQIGPEAFSKCTSLSKINIPAGVKRIENDAFSGCNSIEINFAGKEEQWQSAFSGALPDGSKVNFDVPAPPATVAQALDPASLEPRAPQPAEPAAAVAEAAEDGQGSGHAEEPADGQTAEEIDAYAEEAAAEEIDAPSEEPAAEETSTPDNEQPEETDALFNEPAPEEADTPDDVKLAEENQAQTGDQTTEGTAVGEADGGTEGTAATTESQPSIEAHAACNQPAGEAGSAPQAQPSEAPGTTVVEPAPGQITVLTGGQPPQGTGGAIVE